MNGAGDARLGIAPTPLVPLMLAFAGVYTIWGTTYLAIAIAIRTVPPFSAGTVRFLLAGGVLYLWLRARERRPFAELNIPGTLLCGTLMSGFGNGLTMWAQRGLPSGVTALFVASLPVWILLLDWLFFLRLPPSPAGALGVVLGLAGTLVLSVHSHSLAASVRPIHLLSLFCAQSAWALATLLQRRYVVRHRIIAFTCLQLLAGSACQLVFAVLTGDWRQLSLGQVSAESVGAVLYLAIVGSIVATTCYSYLLAHVSAHKVATYALVNPVIAMALGALVLGERITPAALLASGLVLAGVALVLLPDWRYWGRSTG